MEETSQDLQQTRLKLSEEEFICSELSSARDSLYSTAGEVRSCATASCHFLLSHFQAPPLMAVSLCVFLQLLSTVDASTSDVSGLHDKLDRKKKVSAFLKFCPFIFPSRWRHIRLLLLLSATGCSDSNCVITR